VRTAQKYSGVAYSDFSRIRNADLGPGNQREIDDIMLTYQQHRDRCIKSIS